MNKQDNILIAKFMGITPSLCQTFGKYSLSDMPFWAVTGPTPEKVWEDAAKCFKYDSSWDALMPVVEKIESMNFDVSIGSGCFCRIWDVDFDREVILPEIESSYPTKIGSTYKAVVEFIKWYNKNK